MNRAPDQPERDLATDISRSVIVQAPAGSGKTTLLVERYLKLLAIVSKPEEILAITFTRKAASEMQNRVLDALHRASSDQHANHPAATAALARSRALGWQLLDQPSRLKIQTIDSFAMSLTRGLPTSSGFDPGLGLTETASHLYQGAANRLLLRLYEQSPLTEEIADFLRQCDNDSNRAVRLLATMLSKRDQWLEVTGSVVSTYQTQQAEVSAVLQKGVQTLHDEVIERFQQALGAAALHELNTLVDHAATALDIDLVGDHHERYRLIAETLTTARGEFRKQVTKREGFSTDFPALKKRVMALIDDLSDRHLEQQVANLRFLPTPNLDPEAVHRLVNVCINLTLANTELAEIFRQAQATDFTTLILSAQLALGQSLEPTELALALDYRIHHVLVDEFQDTSVSQFRLFERLLGGWSPGDGNSFFAVGDPMQSIYRFRDADVGLFFQAWEHGIAALELETVVLTSNFRADARVVRWTNHAFARIMGDQQDPVLGQIAYRPATPTIAAGGESPAVSLQLHSDQPTQVESITTTIERLLASSEDTIAVLVRSRGQLRDLIETLRQRGISWHANDIDPLLNKSAVRDLLTLVHALGDPADRLSWISLLRSPLVGLTLTDLEMLTDVKDFPAFLEQPADWLVTDSGRARLQRLADAWFSVVPWLDEQPPRRIVETLWLKLGGTDAYGEPEALIHATRLLELIDSLGAQGLSGEAVSQAATRLFAADMTDSRLQILTIHKAKGLEFDHVLVPFLERTTRSDETELLLWRALPHGLLMGVRNEEGPFQWLARENRFRQRHERQRLFYVACTRARQSLTLFATPPDKPAESAMLALLWPMIESGNSGELQIAHYTDQQASACKAVQVDLLKEPVRTESGPASKSLQRLKENYRWQAPALSELIFEPQTVAAKQGDPLDKRPEVVLGIIIHAVMERLSATPLPADILAYLEREQPVWETMARSHDLQDNLIETVVNGVRQQIARVLSDPVGRWLLSARQESQAELEVTGIIDGQPVSLVIDRTFVDEGSRWVIDYKTSVPAADTTREDFVQTELSRYRGQLTRYATLAEALFGQAPRLAIYFTGFTHLEELVLADLPAG